VLVVLESSKKGLSLNFKKTETMVISKNSDIPKFTIKSNGTILTQVHEFKYLGTTMEEVSLKLTAELYKPMQHSRE